MEEKTMSTITVKVPYAGLICKRQLMGEKLEDVVIKQALRNCPSDFRIIFTKDQDCLGLYSDDLEEYCSQEIRYSVTFPSINQAVVVFESYTSVPMPDIPKMQHSQDWQFLVSKTLEKSPQQIKNIFRGEVVSIPPLSGLQKKIFVEYDDDNGRDCITFGVEAEVTVNNVEVLRHNKPKGSRNTELIDVARDLIPDDFRQKMVEYRKHCVLNNLPFDLKAKVNAYSEITGEAWVIFSYELFKA